MTKPKPAACRGATAPTDELLALASAVGRLAANAFESGALPGGWTLVEFLGEFLYLPPDDEEPFADPEDFGRR